MFGTLYRSRRVKPRPENGYRVCSQDKERKA